jgi:hypothetical protein
MSEKSLLTFYRIWTLVRWRQVYTFLPIERRSVMVPLRLLLNNSVQTLYLSKTQKGTIATVQASKAYRRTEHISPLILNTC